MATSERVRDALVLLQADRATHTLYDNYYRGRVEERFTSTKHRQFISDTGDAYRLNFVATAVDVPLSMLEMQGLICEDESAREYLDGVYKDNKFDFEFKEAVRMALVMKESAIIALPDSDMESGVSLYAHDPRSVKVFYDPRRPRKRMAAVHIYMAYAEEEQESLQTGMPYLFVTYYTTTTIEQWASSAPLTRNVSVDLNTVDLHLIQEIPTPVPGTLPVFHVRPGGQHSEGLVYPVMGCQDMLNTTNITLMTSLQSAGFPQRYWLADKMSEFRDNFSDAVPSTSGESAISDAHGNPVSSKDLVSGPNTNWLLSGANLKVGQFDAVQSSNFLEPIEAELGWFARISSVPTSYYRASAQPESGESKRESRRPLIDMVSELKVYIGTTVKELNNYLLVLGRRPIVDTEPAWKSLAEDDNEWWTTAKIKREMGVPTHVILVESGLYNEETINGWQDDGFAKDPSETQSNTDPQTNSPEEIV